MATSLPCKMKKNRQLAQQLFRQTHLLGTVDNIRYIVSIIANYSRNRAFVKKHQEFCFPPSFLAFDAYSAVNWYHYYESGIRYAQKLSETFKKYSNENQIAILEWGCGPGRIIRHMNSFIPAARLHGADYNRKTIKWCLEHIPHVDFSRNNLVPPLSYNDGSFDFIYVHSVFTHLSVELGLSWMEELRRVLKVGGILYFTTHSDGSAQNLLPPEYEIYKNAGVFVRGQTKEGKKMFGTWHSPDYVENIMLKNMRILEHFNTGVWTETGPQDGWVVSKAC